METETPNRMSLARVALHYSTRPFSQAQEKVQKATRSASQALKSNPSSKDRKKSVVSLSSRKSSVSSPLEVDQFHLFVALPAELRLKIWQHTLPGPRVVQLREGKTRQAKLVNRQLVVPWVSHIPVPKLLHVCRESREEGLRFYKLAFGKPGIHPPRIYIDFEVDVVFFGRRDNGATLISHIGTLDTPSLSATDFASSPSFSEIQKIALIPKGVLELVEWEWKVLMATKLKEIWVVDQMTEGRSFRLGRSPRLVVVEIPRDQVPDGSSTARTMKVMDKGRTRLRQREVGSDLKDSGRESLPAVKTCEFAFAEGDEWVGPPRYPPLQSRGSVGVTNFFVV